MGKIIEDFSQFLSMIEEKQEGHPVEDDSGVDYAAEYKKQTGRDLETGEYVVQ